MDQALRDALAALAAAIQAAGGDLLLRRQLLEMANHLIALHLRIRAIEQKRGG